MTIINIGDLKRKYTYHGLYLVVFFLFFSLDTLTLKPNNESIVGSVYRHYTISRATE